MLKNIYLVTLIFVLAMISCRSSPPTPDLFAGAQTVLLTGEGITLKLPAYFKRSNPEQLTEDIPWLEGDTIFFWSIDNFIKGFNFKDQELDVLVDTTSELRCLIIAEGPRFDLNAAAGKKLNKQLGEYFRQMDEADLFLEINKIQSRMKVNRDIEMLKYKYEMVHTQNRTSYYQTLFFISNPRRSLLVVEVSFDGEDVEDYFWTVKG